MQKEQPTVQAWKLQAVAGSEVSPAVGNEEVVVVWAWGAKGWSCVPLWGHAPSFKDSFLTLWTECQVHSALTSSLTAYQGSWESRIQKCRLSPHLFPQGLWNPQCLGIQFEAHKSQGEGTLPSGEGEAVEMGVWVSPCRHLLMHWKGKKSFWNSK